MTKNNKEGVNYGNNTFQSRNPGTRGNLAQIRHTDTGHNHNGRTQQSGESITRSSERTQTDNRRSIRPRSSAEQCKERGSAGIQHGQSESSLDVLKNTFKVIDAPTFKHDFDEAKSKSKFGLSVDTHEIDELKTMTCLKSSNGFVAVSEDGNINSVLRDNSKQKTPDFMIRLMANAVNHGGKKLDCYAIPDTTLSDFGLATKYSQLGFIPVVKTKFAPEYVPDDWDYSQYKEPDVVFMYYCGDDMETYMNKAINNEYTSYDPSTIPYITDIYPDIKTEDQYEKAMEFRDAEMNKALSPQNNKVSLDKIQQSILEIDSTFNTNKDDLDDQDDDTDDYTDPKF